MEGLGFRVQMLFSSSGWGLESLEVMVMHLGLQISIPSLRLSFGEVDS